LKKHALWYVLALIILALPLIVPFGANGLPYTADIEIHMHRLVSAAANLQNGYFWPRWTPYLHIGFGYPIHNFYAPGLHIVGALVYLATHLDPIVILKLLQFGITLLYPLGAYLFARTFTGRTGAFVAAIAYLYTPLRFQELWVQSNLSQFFAMALLPYVLWAMARSAQREKGKWIVAIGVFFALIIVMHHPTAFLFAPFAGFYALLMSLIQPRRAFLKAMIRTCSGLALGLALSAVFWLPALLELRYTQINSLQTGMFSIGDNAVPLGNILAATHPIDRALESIPAQLQIGLLQWIAALVGLLALRLPGQRLLKWNLLAGVAVTIFCTWMITPSATPLWNLLPIANLVVYPWRLLGVIGVAVLPGVAALPALFPPRWRTAAASGLVVLFFANTLPLLYAPLVFYTPNPPTIKGETNFEERTGNVGLTSADEYLPINATQRPLIPTYHETDDVQWHVFLESLPSEVQATDEACDRGVDCYLISAPSPTTITFHQMYFPGWQASLNGQAVDPQPSGPYGLITFQIPAGQTHVRLWYGGTTVQHVADTISLGAGLLIILFLGYAWLKARRPAQQATVDTPPNRPVVQEEDSSGLAKFSIVGMIAFLILNQLVLIPNTQLFRPSSNPAAPPASHPLHVVFGDALELVGYDIDKDSAAPGDSVRVQLYWHLHKDPTLSLHSSVQMTSIDNQVVWGKHDAINLGGIDSTKMTTDRYTTDLHIVPIAKDALPYLAHINVAVYWVDKDGLHNLQSEQGQTNVTITEVHITGNQISTQPTQTPVKMTLADTIALDGYGLQPSNNGQTCLTLRWRVLRQPQANYTVMIHTVNAAGTMVSAADAPPLNGLYPTLSWQNGQTLDDTHCFTPDATVASLAVGLYDGTTGQRMNMVSEQGARQPDDSFIIRYP
jgi:hypothetical protein